MLIPVDNVGPDSDAFTIELHHGGFFAGYGHLRSYVDEKIDWFDWIDYDTWSALWFEDMFEQLGYDSVTDIKFYWLLLGKDLSDGLRVIATDEDTNVMVSVVRKVRNLVVYVDHIGSMNSVDWDDYVANPVNELPKVLSPQKVVYEKNPAQKLPVFYIDLKKGRVDQAGPGQQPDGDEQQESDGDEQQEPDGDEQQELFDSDYDLSDGDDDLLEDAVNLDMPKVRGNKKANGSHLKAIEIRVPTATAVDDDADTEDDALDLPESDGEGEERMRFNSWNQEDMNNPAFSVELVFPSVESVRKAITEYSVRNRVEIKLPRNDKKRVRAHCADGCPWNLYASWDSRVNSFVVKTYYGKHKCQKEWVLRRCTSRWLADKYIDSFRANEKMSVTSFGRVIQKDWNLTASRSKVARARRLIMKVIHGDEIKQYDNLWDYAQEIRRSNPGSSLYLNLAGNLFSTCFIALDACKRGFLASCRPLICLDGCHIKTKFGGQLLTAVGMDPNDCIFPIAMAIVEVESFVSWEWFLETLKSELGIDNTYPWTIMTDKQKVTHLLLEYLLSVLSASVLTN